jgi:cytochrome c biogenesis protein CcmG/thiol:disulfide interchange protein DsbE
MIGASDLTQERRDSQLPEERRRWRRIAYLLPVLLFAGLAIAFDWGLTRNPREVPSVLIGKPVPEFALPPVQGRTFGLASADLRGEVTLVNVFASWCTACRYEHPLFLRLEAEGTVPIHGLNYKDGPADAAQWLDTLGDPYTRTGSDRDGRVAIDWGVYGVPETYVVSAEGRIVYKHIGPVSEEVLKETIMPKIEALRSGETSGLDLVEGQAGGAKGELAR